MNAGRRHESLIPLSREHHYGLLVCLRIHRGLEIHRSDPGWLRERADKVIGFFETDLETHFAVEEGIVFPVMSGIEEAGEIVEQLVDEHRKLAMLVDRLREPLGLELSALLREFADLLESHIRKEERILFPCYEKTISPQTADQVRSQVLEIIGSAMKPKNPVLLE